jgi:putative redox protein
MNQQKVNFTNSRNLKLAGILLDPPDRTKSIVVVCHGLSGGKEGRGRAIEMGKELTGRGWSSLLFDFAGNGESEGVFKDLTLSGQIDDLNRAVDWCLDQGFTRIITHGRSFGGTTVICQAAHDRRVSGVCTWAAPTDLHRLILGIVDPTQSDEEDLALGKGTETVRLKKNFLSDLEKYDLTVYSAMISPRPFLVIHGTADLSVPPMEAITIYNAAEQPKRLALIEGADHQFSQHYKKVWEILFEWLERNFPV